MAKKKTKTTTKKKPVKKTVKKATPKKKAAPKKAASKKTATRKKPVPKKAAKKKLSTPKAAASNTVNVYLNFNGNCEEAFNFYKKVFGGKFAYLGRFSEMPPNPEKPLSPKEANLIMHVSLPISKETVLMGSDNTMDGPQKYVAGNNFSISVSAKSKGEADRIFKALADGGATIMPMMNTFWGSYFGMLIDKFGISWMISFGQM